MFCPQAIEWGPASDWANVGVGLLVALATLAAVAVALLNAKKSERLARELWTQEHAAQLHREQQKRQTIAFAIDQELISVFHASVSCWERLNPEGAEAAKDSEGVLASALPIDGFDMMERFTADFSLFPPNLTRKLLRILTILSRLRDVLSTNTELKIKPGGLATGELTALLSVLATESRQSRLELREQIPKEVETVKVDPLPKRLQEETPSEPSPASPQ